jgi:hypothetical protein
MLRFFMGSPLLDVPQTYGLWHMDPSATNS